MAGRPRIRIVITMLTGACVTLSACSSAKPGSTVTVTVPPSTSASAPPSSHSASSPPGSAPPPSMSKLPGGCGDLLPAAVVDNVVNSTLHGKTAFVVGTPDRTIARVGYINCRYGVTSAAVPAVEIGVSLYRTAARAAARITATVSDYGNHGASSAKADVSGHPATVVTGGSGPGYDVPTIVLSFGQRTVAISVGGKLASAHRTKTLVALAALALERTAR